MKKKIILGIDANFGSSFQKESALDALALMLRMWNDFYKSTHKLNRFKYSLIEESEPKGKRMNSTFCADCMKSYKGTFHNCPERI